MTGSQDSAIGGGIAENPDSPVNLMLVTAGLGIGGAEMVVRDLARNLDPDRFTVSICCTKGLGHGIDEELLDDGFDVFAIPGNPEKRVDYLSTLKLRRELKARRADIIHTHSTSALFDAAPSRVVLPRTKLVHTFHYGNYPFESWRHHALEYVCSRAADRLVAVGIEQRLRIRETYKLPESRLDTIWNGVTVDSAAHRSTLRSDLGAGDNLIIGTIAKLIEQKGLDDLLAVAKLCKDAQLPFRFVVVGEGPLRGDLERRRKELGLEEVVSITGWIKNAASVVLPEFDVFFQPSRWEAMSIVILEAMAAGKAVVATRVGDNAHVIEDRKSGLLVDSGDLSGMSQALAKLVDENLREELGAAARKRFQGKFTVQHMVSQYERLYSEVIGGRR